MLAPLTITKCSSQKDVYVFKYDNPLYLLCMSGRVAAAAKTCHLISQADEVLSLYHIGQVILMNIFVSLALVNIDRKIKKVLKYAIGMVDEFSLGCVYTNTVRIRH